MIYRQYPAPGAYNIHRLLALRCIILCAQVGALFVVGLWLGRAPPAAALLIVFMILAATTLASWRGFMSLSVLLLIDVVALGTLLYFTGGATNPFGWILLLSVTISATVLTKRPTWFVALIAIAVYSLLMKFYRPLPDAMPRADSGFALHVFGMWVSFILSAVLIAHFVSSMAESARARDRALAQAREQALCDERLIGLGALAASAAHELGTPLATLSVLAEEVVFDLDNRAEDSARRKLLTMREQIKRCKQAISSVASTAGVNAAQSGHIVEMREFIETTVEEWRMRRGDIPVRSNFRGMTMHLVVEQSFASALVNLFDNAADASPGDVGIHVDWNEENLAISVEDRGPGFEPGLRAQAGKAPISGKGEGHGLGLYLSQGIITRLGGSLDIRTRTGGGTAVKVQVPLAGLKV